MGKAEWCKTENGRLLLSSSGMEKAFQVTRQALSDWERQGCPKEGRGWWPLSEVIKWRIERETGRIKAESELSNKERKIKFEADLKEAQTEAAKFKNAVQQGEYLKKEDVTREVGRLFTVFKRAALGIPRTAATEISHCVDETQAREIESLLTEQIRTSLINFSEGIFEDGE